MQYFWMQSQKQQNDLCSFPRQTIQYHSKDTGVGCHFLLQGIFPTQGSNSGLPRCRRTLYRLSQQVLDIRQAKVLAQALMGLSFISISVSGSPFHPSCCDVCTSLSPHLSHCRLIRPGLPTYLFCYLMSSSKTEDISSGQRTSLVSMMPALHIVCYFINVYSLL